LTPFLSHAAWIEIGWNKEEKVRIFIDLETILNNAANEYFN
jgi:hypothetical protein